MNRVMNELQLQFCTDSLMINTTKTIATYFHTRQKRLPLKSQVRFDSMDIIYKLETKFLGI